MPNHPPPDITPGARDGARRHKKTGRIIEAYGFDLSPVAACHAEFGRLVEEGRAERAAKGRSATPGDDRAA